MKRRLAGEKNLYFPQLTHIGKKKKQNKKVRFVETDGYEGWVQSVRPEGDGRTETDDLYKQRTVFGQPGGSSAM